MQQKIWKRGSDSKIGWQFYTSLVLMLMTGLYMRHFMFEEISLPEKILQEFPKKVSIWESIADYQFNGKVLNILKLDDYLNRDYTNKGRRVSLYIGYYRTHRNFAEIHTPEHCQEGAGWVVISEKKGNLKSYGEEDGKINFIEAVYEKDQEKLIFLYWYQTNNRYITNFFNYKINVIMNSILRHRSDAAFVRICVPVINDDINETILVGEQFLKDFVPVINTFLQEV